MLGFGSVAKLVVVDPRAGEVGLLAGGRGTAVFELLVDEIEHERGVDDPDAGGVAAACLGSSKPRSSGTATAHRNGAIAASPNRLRASGHAEGRMRSRDTRRLPADR